MRYADTLLVEGEQIALRTRQHWLAVVIAARHAFALWAVGIALLLVAIFFGWVDGPPGRDLVGLVVLALFAIGLVIFAVRLWQWWAQDYMITNRRLMKVWGVLNKRSVDSALEKVNDAQLDQSVVGRIFNYGHLDILTASAETELDDYDMIRDPKGFKKIMLTQKYALEMSYSTGAPAPPLRAAMDINGEPVQPVVPPPAPGRAAAPDAPPVAEVPDPASTAPAASAEPGDASREITQTLARLADLRDRGALSEEEFQAKKQELLDRL
jgi:membrane protein YdbS with pleckstrin-like domain